MSRLGLRTQLFGIALVLVGAFHDLQVAVRGYGVEGYSLGSLLVVVGLLVVGVGLAWPAIAGGTEARP
jgi:hypothetical protein